MEAEGGAKRRREVENRILEKVGQIISEIKSAKHVDQLICSLHSLALLLFPLDSSLILPTLDQRFKEQILSAKIPSANERKEWWQAFYRGRGAPFPTFARVLLLDVVSDWLACFPVSAKKLVYDVFFVNGLATEVVQALVPFLQYNGNGSVADVNAVQSNTERLLVLCLLENDGVLQIAREFGSSQLYEDFSNVQLQPLASRVAQIVASIPDKAQPKAPALLSSHSFFRQITFQLLHGAQERDKNLSDEESTSYNFELDEVLLGELVSHVLGHIRSFLSSSIDTVMVDLLESDSGSQFWLKIMGAIKDPYAVERISEQLLRQLSIEHTTDTEAYWILWILFNRIFNNQPAVRSLFLDKFLLWKIFPFCCLRWIIQFAVFECPPVSNSLTKGRETHGLLDTTQHLMAVWSRQEFVQSAPMEQQAYVTAAIGLCMERISKEELDNSKDLMHSILQGVSFRLESPTYLIRKMASNIALVFSQAEKDLNYSTNQGRGKSEKAGSKKLSQFKLLDPDEIIDPATLNYGSASDEDEDEAASENSDSSSDSSLQPYDLIDDDTDLKRKLTQLVDVVGALRKSDDADGVERALDVAENLVRASPDELTHIAGDLVRTLVQVRCSDLAVDGEEDTAEEKRQRALVALVVSCPFQSLESLNKLLYSPNVDTSQRITILDVMSEAAQELADSKIMKPKHQSRALISTVSESQAWFLPSSIGPLGAGFWKEVSETGTLLNYSNRYERELPLKPGQIRKGKIRRWSVRSANIPENQLEWTKNKFHVYSAAFMLPAMEGFDKKRHGVDLLGRDFIVLGKLIYMLGVCMRCVSMHPEASALAPSLLDMLRSREICHHKEAYVRKAVLFAASSVLVSLHPSFVASALTEGNLEVSKGLEWVRTWALDVVESDTDRECYTMAMSCLQLHAEMALQASRVLESAESTLKPKSIGVSSNLSKATIKIPFSNFSNVEY
ncbi:TELOMERE LENGTH REGULATION PROTEIN TEL2 FAMILY MEMBER [Salix purpurea]|uniref:TELOMERE LENGTH REGULATION PROTEIN TEL2 FAMILY MEMBER n=1 Tax=Salix purpurea TaxID=77065 RepID=A0A9Q0W5N4_SALPP|nr:TELOMERE LENGTH REGULATION PROTEIN TEL2 FAMILY MEMBER [Salix purpurea]